MSDTRRDSGFGVRPFDGLRAAPSHVEGRDSGDTTPADLDAAIDAVAREMTEAEPSGAFRARVVAEIAETRRHRSPAVPTWAWTAATAMVVLAVATAVWVSRRGPDPVGAPATVAEQRAAQPAARPGSVAAQPVGPAAEAAAAGPAVVAAAGPARAGVVRAARAAGADEQEDVHPVPALVEIEPLAFAAVGPDALQVAAVEIAPFPEMDAIDIPSLDAGSRDIQSADPKKEK